MINWGQYKAVVAGITSSEMESILHDMVRSYLHDHATTIEISELKSLDFYTDIDKKVFFGHYWLKGEPSLYKKNICCLDYSVAKGGKLVAYRLNGETILESQNLTYV